jgi:hypothetical protein
MILLTRDLSEKLPSLRAQKDLIHERKMVYAKFFFPAGRWTWFVMEGEAKADDFLFFGYVVTITERFGYFTLKNLESIRIAGLTIERDRDFRPGKFKDVIEQFRAER